MASQDLSQSLVNKACISHPKELIRFIGIGEQAIGNFGNKSNIMCDQCASERNVNYQDLMVLRKEGIPKEKVIQYWPVKDSEINNQLNQIIQYDFEDYIKKIKHFCKLLKGEIFDNLDKFEKKNIEYCTKLQKQKADTLEKYNSLCRKQELNSLIIGGNFQILQDRFDKIKELVTEVLKNKDLIKTELQHILKQNKLITGEIDLLTPEMHKKTILMCLDQINFFPSLDSENQSESLGFQRIDQIMTMIRNRQNSSQDQYCDSLETQLKKYSSIFATFDLPIFPNRPIKGLQNGKKLQVDFKQSKNSYRQIVGQIQTLYDDRQSVGSGAVLSYGGRCLLLTSASNFFKKTINFYKQEILSEVDQATFNFQQTEYESCLIPSIIDKKVYYDSYSQNTNIFEGTDFGLGSLREEQKIYGNVSSNCQWGFIENLNPQVGEPISIIGYSASEGMCFEILGTISELKPQTSYQGSVMLFTNMESITGLRGSPVFLKRGDAQTIIGVYQGVGKNSVGQDCGIVAAINKKVNEWIIKQFNILK